MQLHVLDTIAEAVLSAIHLCQQFAFEGCIHQAVAQSSDSILLPNTQFFQNHRSHTADAMHRDLYESMMFQTSYSADLIF